LGGASFSLFLSYIKKTKDYFKKNFILFLAKKEELNQTLLDFEKTILKMSIDDFSNPSIALRKAKAYLGPNVKFKLSDNPKKKYMILNPLMNKWIHFGQMGYEDFTKHQDEKRRENYLKRTANMRGDWKDNKYSPNNLSRNILW